LTTFRFKPNWPSQKWQNFAKTCFELRTYAAKVLFGTLIDFLCNSIDLECEDLLNDLYLNFRDEENIIDNLADDESSNTMRAQIFAEIVKAMDVSLTNICRICRMSPVTYQSNSDSLDSDDATNWIGCNTNEDHWFHRDCFSKTC
jgi:hypothetical protein